MNMRVDPAALMAPADHRSAFGLYLGKTNAWAHHLEWPDGSCRTSAVCDDVMGRLRDAIDHLDCRQVFITGFDDRAIEAAQWFCMAQGLAYGPISLRTVRKFTTGRANATSGMMLDAVRSWGFRPAGVPEAFAVAAVRCGLAG